MKNFLGIDPGKKGFFVVIDEEGNLVEAINIPQIGNEYDKREIHNFFTKREYHHIGLENPGIIHGVSKSSLVSLQKCVSLIEGIMYPTQISHSLIQPKEWQSIMWKNIKKQYIDGKKVDTKATSLLAAQNLFPKVDFKITEKGSPSKNYNDNFVDAILVAEYVRRLYITQTS